MTNEELAVRIKAGLDVTENMLDLWQQNKRFIYKIAKKYSGHAELEDLEQEGYLALYDAVDGFDPGKGVRFLTYAAYWIEQKMQRYVRSSGALHISEGELAKVREYHKMVNAFELHFGRKPTEDEIARSMGLSGKEAAELLCTAAVGQIASLESPLPGEDGDMTIGDSIPGETESADTVIGKMHQEQLKHAIWEAVDSLQQQQALVIRKRYMDEMSFAAAGAALGITGDKVRQEEAKGIRALREPHAYPELHELAGDMRYSEALRGGGVAQFRTTWTSSTERVALRKVRQ